MLLGLDIATKTGFAFGGTADGAPRTGVWRLPGLDANTIDRSLSALHESVRQLCGAAGVEIVAIEAPLQIDSRSARTALGLISLCAVARAAAHRHGAQVRMVHVQSVRKHFVGNGRPANPKQAVMDRCDLLGWKFEDDNAADAAAVWAYGMSVSYPKWSPRGTPLFGRAAA